MKQQQCADFCLVHNAAVIWSILNHETSQILKRQSNAFPYSYTPWGVAVMDVQVDAGEVQNSLWKMAS